MLKKLTSFLLIKLGKSDYKLDSSLSSWNLFYIVVYYILPFLRGLFLKLRLKKSQGIVFLGSYSKIKFTRKLSLGKTVTIGSNVKINALSKKGVVIGNNVSILDNTIIECTGVIRNLGEGLVVGNNVGIAQNCFIQVRGNVTIGNNVIFGPNVKVFSENHIFEDINIPIKDQGETRLDLIIEDDVWVGTNSTILGGVTIGKGSVIAANSLVNKNVEPYSVVGGVPAKLLKKRN